MWVDTNYIEDTLTRNMQALGKTNSAFNEPTW